jgi:hypothetical protein
MEGVFRGAALVVCLEVPSTHPVYQEGIYFWTYQPIDTRLVHWGGYWIFFVFILVVLLLEPIFSLKNSIPVWNISTRCFSKLSTCLVLVLSIKVHGWCLAGMKRVYSVVWFLLFGRFRFSGWLLGNWTVCSRFWEKHPNRSLNQEHLTFG